MGHTAQFLVLCFCCTMGVTFHEDVVFNGTDEPVKLGRWAQFVHDLKQQRLPGKYPVATKRHAISTTAFFGFLFIGISLLLKSANRQVVLLKFRYDNVTSGDIHFQLKKYIPPPIFFYYELQNTFMMHRSANGAFCEEELTGLSLFSEYKDDTARRLCDTFKNQKYMCECPVEAIFRFNSYCTEAEKFYAPIGATASLMFNDSFLLTRDDQPIIWTEEGVISERRRENVVEPEEGTDNLCRAKMFKNTLKPIGWEKHICEMGGYRNNTLLKWLEPTTNKNFKKLYRILDTDYHPGGLEIGNYTLHTDNSYWPRKSQSPEFRMKKFFWILHPSWVGTEQKFLEVMYLVVGIGLILLSSFLVGFQTFMMNRRKHYSDDE